MTTENTKARVMMVDTQIRPSDVTKFPIIEAFLSVPREEFVPSGLRKVAYAGENLPLEAGRIILEPRSFAKMLDVLDVQQSDLVLDIGTGLGYSAAILARMCQTVIGVEDDPERVRLAEQALAEQGVDNVAIVEAALDAGAPKAGPFDVIIIQGAIEKLPSAIADQLKEGGRIGAIFSENALGECRVGRKSGGKITWRGAFNAGAPILPGYTADEAFTL